MYTLVVLSLLTEKTFILLIFIAMRFEITKSELGFLSDLLAGTQTPRALLNIGNFIGHTAVSNQVLGYQNILDELVKGQTVAIEALAKEYFEQDENGQPKIETATNPEGQEVQKWILIPGKDQAEFEKLYKEKTDESMKARSDLGLEKVAIEIEENVFFNFKNSVLDDVKIIDVMRNLNIEPKKHQEFIGVLYSVLASLDSIQA